MDRLYFVTESHDAKKNGGEMRSYRVFAWWLAVWHGSDIRKATLADGDLCSDRIRGSQNMLL